RGANSEPGGRRNTSDPGPHTMLGPSGYRGRGVGEMSALREIFVKAVCARGRETFQRTHRFRAKYHPEEILGSRVTNPQCRAVMQDGRVRVVGAYDVHVWYSYTSGSQEDGSPGGTHTAVAVQTFEFSAPVPVESLVDDLSAAQNPEV